MQKILNLFKQNFVESQNPVLAVRLQTLQASLTNTIRLLGKTSIKKNGKNIKLNRLPWVLVIGAGGAGKTSLIANSKINFILDKARRENIKASKEEFNWWATRDLILMDVPSSFVSNSLTNNVWEGFLDFVSQMRGNKGVRGVIVTLSLPELLDKTNREQTINNLQYRLAQLRTKFSADLPVYLTLTKCDLIPGFKDFFNDLAIDELAQVWGFSFNSKESLADICVKRFDILINRLNKQLIWRLHQERNVYTRTYIKDFPLQIERVKENCVDTLKAITRLDNNFTLKGLYLTSAMQNENKSDAYPKTVSADELQRSMEIMNATHSDKQSFFIKQFLLQSIVPAEAALVEHEWSLSFTISALAVGFMLIFAGVQGKQFLDNLNHYSELRKDIYKKQQMIYQANQQKMDDASRKMLNAKMVSQL